MPSLPHLPSKRSRCSDKVGRGKQPPGLKRPCCSTESQTGSPPRPVADEMLQNLRPTLSNRGHSLLQCQPAPPSSSPCRSKLPQSERYFPHAHHASRKRAREQTSVAVVSLTTPLS